MSRAITMLLGCLALSGCARLHQTTDCPCDDCLPPPVAGRFHYQGYLDNCLTTCTAQKCAKRDLKQMHCADDALPPDFQEGYTQAYIDLAAGRSACVPAVPPKKYWHAWHRSCAGRDAVDQWYAGYRNGLDHGAYSGVSRFNRIVPSPDGCCVSAAYINPYATPQSPTGIMPADGQTISSQPAASPTEFTAAATDAQDSQIVPAQSSALIP